MGGVGRTRGEERGDAIILIKVYLKKKRLPLDDKMGKSVFLHKGNQSSKELQSQGCSQQHFLRIPAGGNVTPWKKLGPPFLNFQAR